LELVSHFFIHLAAPLLTQTLRASKIGTPDICTHLAQRELIIQSFIHVKLFIYFISFVEQKHWRSWEVTDERAILSRSFLRTCDAVRMMFCTELDNYNPHSSRNDG
jgi:hypothetical protein